MYKKADLHLHTNASDGKLTPKEIVRFAKDQNIDMIAITDHDTTKGINEALIEGKKIGIKVIPGIEISTLHKGESIHILGYFNNTMYENSYFQNYLKTINNYRILRAEKMVENLHKFFNIKLNYKEIIENSHGIVARPHIAKAIIDNGYNYSWNYIFENLINEDSPAYVPNKKLSIQEALELLKKTNALTVLAHPILIKKSSLEELLKFDFHGIEAIYYKNTKDDTKKFKSIANKYNKIITAGSDFHGITKSDGSHAAKIGDVFLKKKNIEIFLNKLKNH